MTQARKIDERLVPEIAAAQSHYWNANTTPLGYHQLLCPSGIASDYTIRWTGRLRIPLFIGVTFTNGKPPEQGILGAL